MRITVKAASGLAVAAAMLNALLASSGSSALAQATDPVPLPEPVEIQAPVEAEVPQLPTAALESIPVETAAIIEAEPKPSAARAASLAALVKSQPRSLALNSEMRCLAGVIYFEARGESLYGQLAVGRVVVERASSGRFPASYCGVVFQRSQFSFVRGRSLPSVQEGTAAWHRAVAIARIADQGSWQSKADGALFFHATHASPGWRLKRLAQVDNHIFYR